MEHKRLYRLSAKLHDLQRRYGCSCQLLELHAYRYKYFIDSSPRGVHCKYARGTLRLYELEEGAKHAEEYLRSLRPEPPGLEQLLELL